jgi:hypothetical protein
MAAIATLAAWVLTGAALVDRNSLLALSQDRIAANVLDIMTESLPLWFVILWHG